MSLTKVDLPEPETPVTTTRQPDRELDVDVVQVVLLGAPHDEPAPRLPAPGGHGHEALAGQVLTGQRSLVAQQFLDGPRHHDLAAVLTRPGADVDHVVGGADGLFVVLDDDDGVAQVAQADQGVDQLAVVPLVQADGRLVEHIQHSHQAAADLGGQADALRLASGQRAGIAVEGQVVEADVDQELQPGPDFTQDPVGDQVVALGKLQVRHQSGRLPDGQVAHLEYAAVPDGHGQAGGL